MDAAHLQQAALARLAQLRPGTTMCPGRLARELGTRLADFRPHLAALEASAAIEILQRGEPVKLQDLRGPFRVRLRKVQD